MKTNLHNHALLAGTVCTGTILFGVCNASAGDFILVSTSSGQTVNEVSPGGGHVTAVVSGLDYPDGIAFDSAGDLFIANTGLNAAPGNIIKVTPRGIQTIFASGIDPSSIAFDHAGNLFVADYGSGNIYEFAPNGSQATFASGFSFPIALAFDHMGNLFVGSGYGPDNGLITEITPGGDQTTFASGLDFPRSFAFDKAGNLFEADNGSGNINKFSRAAPPGTYSTIANVDDVGGLAFDHGGNLIVAGSGGSSMVALVQITRGGREKTLATFPGNPTSGVILAR